jgi:hypothetical protein
VLKPLSDRIIAHDEELHARLFHGCFKSQLNGGMGGGRIHNKCALIAARPCSCCETIGDDLHWALVLALGEGHVDSPRVAGR